MTNSAPDRSNSALRISRRDRHMKLAIFLDALFQPEAIGEVQNFRVLPGLARVEVGSVLDVISFRSFRVLAILLLKTARTNPSSAQTGGHWLTAPPMGYER